VNYHRGKRSEPLRTDWPAHVQANEAAQRAALAFTLDVMEAHPDMATIGKLEYVGRDIAFHRKQIAQLQDQMAEHHETIEERMQDRGRLRAALNDPATWPVAKETEE
jgi:hypothetical protein